MNTSELLISWEALDRMIAAEENEDAADALFDARENVEADIFAEPATRQSVVDQARLLPQLVANLEGCMNSEELIERAQAIADNLRAVAAAEDSELAKRMEASRGNAMVPVACTMTDMDSREAGPIVTWMPRRIAERDGWEILAADDPRIEARRGAAQANVTAS